MDYVNTPDHLLYVEKLPTSSMEKYNIIKQVTRGGFGMIHEACLADNSDDTRFAIKSKICSEATIVTNIELQEIHALKTLENVENVIQLVDIIRKPSSLLIVMNLAKTDLQALIMNLAIPINTNEIKAIFKQLLSGLSGIHKHGFLHRDIKPGNILITYNGIIKITDFGMSVHLTPKTAKQTKLLGDIGSLWYRAPEIILGDDHYDNKVDMWSTGVLATELWTRRLLLHGLDNTTQMGKVAKLCGFPTPDVWPRVTTLKRYTYLKETYGSNTCSHLLPLELLNYTDKDVNATDLLLGLFKLDPLQRTSAEEALQHSYFTAAPVDPDIKSIVENDNF